MTNTIMANNTFLTFYYNKKSDHDELDLNSAEDRFKLVVEIFSYSNINSDSKNKLLFDEFVRDFYNDKKSKNSENIIVSQEL